MDANDTAKKKMLKRPQTYNKTPCATVKNAYTCSKNKIRILEVNFCENKIVKIQLVFIGFFGFEEYRDFMVQKQLVFIGFPGFEESFEKV